MNLSDIKNRFSRQPQNRADPAHAFGSEEQLMEEFMRQNYVPPQPGSRAGAVLSGLRDRLASAVRHPRVDAPVYSADTYAQESAPDLGWEAAFSPQEEPAEPEERTPTAQERFESFRQTVYASPTPRQAPGYGAYPQSGYYQAPGGAPVYEEIRLRGNARRDNALPKAVYEDLTYPQRRQPAPDAPPYDAPYEAPETASYADGSQPYGEEAFFDPQLPYGEAPRPDPFGYPGEGFAPGQFTAPVPPQAPAAKGGDWKYFFWSGSIVAGAALTFFSFIYACLI